ncbi:G-protein coupled receptor 35 [Aplochiton taeniatus]
MLEGVGYTGVFVLGLLLNVAALSMLMARRARWMDTHVYMVNLAAADLALIVFLPFRIYNAFFSLEKSFLCTFLISTHYINMYASILTGVAVSVHRYLAVRFPLRARAWRRKKQAALAVCLAIWVTVVAICAAYRRDNYPEKLWTCYARREDIRLTPAFLLLLVGLGYLGPLLVIVFCSSQTIYILSRAKEEGLTADKRSVAGVVKANMIVFIVCYTPIHVGFLLIYYMSNPDWDFTHTPAHLYLLAAEWVSTTNCCLDAISYYFLLKRFYTEAVTRAQG